MKKSGKEGEGGCMYIAVLIAAKLNYLLPPKRDTSVTSRLRAATPYPRPTLRTKKYGSFINYGLSHYQ